MAFVIGVFARYLVGWRVSRSRQTDFVLEALEQALYARQPARDGAPMHHPDRGSRYVSIRYSERLAEADIEPPVGGKGDRYDHALAETINGLYQAEVIHRCGPWKPAEAVELATLEWVANSTITGFWNPLAISLRQQLRQTTIGNLPSRP